MPEGEGFVLFCICVEGVPVWLGVSVGMCVVCKEGFVSIRGDRTQECLCFVSKGERGSGSWCERVL